MSTFTVTAPIILPIDNVGDVVWDPAACIRNGIDTSFVMMGTRADHQRLIPLVPTSLLAHSGFTYSVLRPFYSDQTPRESFEELHLLLRHARHDGIVIFAVVPTTFPSNMRHWLKNP